MAKGAHIMGECVFKDCKKKGQVVRTARGLCSACYAVAQEDVKKKKITWKELEDAGLAKPSRQGVGPNIHRSPMGKAIDAMILKKLEEM